MSHCKYCAALSDCKRAPKDKTCLEIRKKHEEEYKAALEKLFANTSVFTINGDRFATANTVTIEYQPGIWCRT